MTLSTDQMTLLREAIAEGYFNPPVNPNAPTKGPLTSAVLSTVAGMADNVILANLTLYQQSKITGLTNTITAFQAKITDMQTSITTLSAISLTASSSTTSGSGSGG